MRLPTNAMNEPRPAAVWPQDAGRCRQQSPCLGLRDHAPKKRPQPTRRPRMKEEEKKDEKRKSVPVQYMALLFTNSITQKG